jgi:glycerol-3-phosphate O-acyltransferase
VGFIRDRINRSALRSLKRRGSRVDRFKLTSRPRIRALLLQNEQIARAVKVHAKEKEISEAVTWRTVEAYVDEIVPFFSILAYYRFGYFVSRTLLNTLYKVSAEQHGSAGAKSLPDDAIVVYLMNHR